MKSLHFIFFCMITISLYLFSKSTASSAASTFYPGRRTFTEVPISPPNQKNPHHNTQCEMQAIDDKTKQSTVKYAASTDDFDEIVYHIDYHGVTTHPTPTPRHPKP
ncbi:hypothetical protein AB3S75_018229 [Citrus x aurantiifolia]